MTRVLARSVVGWHQPVDWPARATVADPSLPHQIRISNVDNVLYASCNCMKVKSPFGPSSYPPLGRFATLAEAWDLFNAHLPQDVAVTP